MNIELEEFYTFPTRVKIASILRKAIFSGDIKAGEELSLTDVANKLNVSRTPVREAFQILESENLLELRMNKGAIVKCIDDNFFKDYYEVRILLETKAIEKAINNNIDVSYLEKIHNDFERNIESSTEEDYKKYNQNFHFYIWKNANNEKLFSILLSLWNGPSFQIIGKGNYVNDSLEEHKEIIEAIKEKNIKKAISCVETHLNTSLKNILALKKW
ncbi:GntR family transcriptional regulator [Fusobacterium simiae]|uniref:GntR family transcriptional regulator n=2 Tax=Fusobacterium TaxID=848 RepID=A0ABT4DLH1_FUSSI|nr:GntR family transcriptional regulator [Fusobacterium simiae]MCY7008251.1 GntR family transcriptional regulator [Fusobacterium simiae]